MSAVKAIRKARAIGIHIEIDGNDLLLASTTPPPADLLDMLARHKLDIVMLLRTGLAESGGKLPGPGADPFAEAAAALEQKCPEYVEVERWQQCLADAQNFLAKWGQQAEALGWTVEGLFGLHHPPEHPHPTYRGLSRYDELGLLWLLLGHPVVAIAETTAAIQSGSGAITIYTKINKPALGAIGDSLNNLA